LKRCQSRFSCPQFRGDLCAFGRVIAAVKLRTKFLDLLFDSHDDLLIVVMTGGAARRCAGRVKDRAAAAKRRWGSRFFVGGAQLEDGAQGPTAHKKWWGPVVLEAGRAAVDTWRTRADNPLLTLPFAPHDLSNSSIRRA
jgi:hypothetical protein